MKQDPTQANLRQLHPVQAELLAGLQAQGFAVAAGTIGENVLTEGIVLLALPTGTRLKLGAEALVEITGLRNPCAQLDNYRKGLTAAVLDRDAEGHLVRKAGVIGVVLAGGAVGAGAPGGARRPPRAPPPPARGGAADPCGPATRSKRSCRRCRTARRSGSDPGRSTGIPFPQRRSTLMRYAVYFTPPPDAPLTRLAASWLQRDAFGGDVPPFPSSLGLSAEEVWPLTAEPRRYGFHATLKAPFRLAPGRDEEALADAFQAFCTSQQAVTLPRLVVRRLGNFLALVPEAPSAALDRLAGDAVTAFEPFRAPLDDAEIARRRPERLSASERENLQRWGYPHVFADFRFHMILTGPSLGGATPKLLKTLQAVFGPELSQPLRTESLGLFLEPAPRADFKVLRFVRLHAR